MRISLIGNETIKDQLFPVDIANSIFLKQFHSLSNKMTINSSIGIGCGRENKYCNKIIYHDFLIATRRGIHVKSDKTHT